MDEEEKNSQKIVNSFFLMVEQRNRAHQIPTPSFAPNHYLPKISFFTTTVFKNPN